MTSSPVSVTVGASSGGSSSLFFIHADQLNTPRVVEDRNQHTVWSWQQNEPFGDSPPNQGTVTGGAFVFNLRFGGVTYYDQETGTLQNTHRDLDPALGRYVQSDPIGLDGGINTYAYVGGSPLDQIDLDGTITSDRASCLSNPQLCAELFGDMAVNAAMIAAKMNGPSAEACLALEAAGKFKKALRIASWLPFVARAGAWLPQIATLGGRLGNQATREHVGQVAAELEKRGWKITHGGGRGPEEYLRGLGGGRKGSSYVDITATKNGNTLRVNTVDTYADGVTPTIREAANAARIRAQTGEHLLLIPKP